MSVKHMSRIWDSAPVEGTALLMLLAIADHANDDGQCWPRMERLAQKCRVSLRQARRLINQLQEQGHIETRRGGGRGNYNMIQLKEDIGVPVSTAKPDTDVPVSAGKPDTHVPLLHPQTRTSMSPFRPKSARKEDIPSHARVEPNALTTTTTTTTTTAFPDTPSTTKPAKRPESSEPRDLTHQQKYFALVCSIVGWDPKVLTKDQQGQVAQTVRILSEGQYGLEDLVAFWNQIWKKDWRVIRNPKCRPTLKQLREEIGKLRVDDRGLEEFSDGANQEPSEEEFRRQYFEAKERQRAAAAAAAGAPQVQCVQRQGLGLPPDIERPIAGTPRPM